MLVSFADLKPTEFTLATEPGGAMRRHDELIDSTELVEVIGAFVGLSRPASFEICAPSFIASVTGLLIKKQGTLYVLGHPFA